MISRMVLVVAAGVAVILLVVGLYQCEPKSDPPGTEPKEPEATVEPAPAPEPIPPAPSAAPDPEPIPLSPPAPVVPVLPDTGGLGG